jgi:hypothetical protein
VAHPLIVDALRLQAGWCVRLGSPLYARLLRLAAADLDNGGVMDAVVDEWEGDPVRNALALRLMGGVHRLVLSGHAPELAQHFPSAGGSPIWPDVGTAFFETIAVNEAAVKDALFVPVQTNEVGRSAVILGGALGAAASTELPLNVLEVGSSGGLNLLFDQYRYELSGAEWGDPQSPVLIRSAWSGTLPDTAAPLVVASRAGCDRNPIDVRDEADVLRLRSFVWADQVERFQRTEAAVAVAQSDPPRVDRIAAERWLPDLLAQRPRDTATLVMHTVVLSYVTIHERAAIEDAVAGAGDAATSEAPVGWLRMEPAAGRMEVRLTLWPGAEERLLGHAHAHGAHVRWQ